MSHKRAWRRPCPSGKVKFPTAVAARLAAGKLSERIGIPLFVYRCARCGFFHRTKQRRPITVSLLEFVEQVIKGLAFEHDGAGTVVSGIKCDEAGQITAFIEYRAPDLPVTGD